MTHHFPAPPFARGAPVRTGSPSRGFALACLAAGVLACSVARAEDPGVTASQRATASQVAQAGVALSELAPGAPSRYTIKAGDTLWAISGLYLRTPWRWPELWGMNLNDIRNPHRIYPGQVLVLDTSSGRAMLRMQADATVADGDVPTVRVSPRTRYESLSESAIPPVSMQAIQPFLEEVLVVDEPVFSQAPRVVAAQESRVLLSRGDRAYARSQGGMTGPDRLSTDAGQPRLFRVFRNATALKDPATGDILGHEAHYVGRVRLVRSETVRETVNKKGEPSQEIVPATIDILATKEEIRAGDRLIPEPPRDFSSFVPRAADKPLTGQIVSVYGNAVKYAAQNQVVVINRGSEQGVENGHVLMIMKDGHTVVDRTDAQRPSIRLPSETNGLMVVFKTYERLSYALVLDITDGVKVGDRFVTP